MTHDVWADTGAVFLGIIAGCVWIVASGDWGVHYTTLGLLPVSCLSCPTFGARIPGCWAGVTSHHITTLHSSLVHPGPAGVLVTVNTGGVMSQDNLQAPLHLPHHSSLVPAHLSMLTLGWCQVTGCLWAGPWSRWVCPLCDHLT